jgi:hypothetical protein
VNSLRCAIEMSFGISAAGSSAGRRTRCVPVSFVTTKCDGLQSVPTGNRARDEPGHDVPAFTASVGEIGERVSRDAARREDERCFFVLGQRRGRDACFRTPADQPESSCRARNAASDGHAVLREGSKVLGRIRSTRRRLGFGLHAVVNSLQVLCKINSHLHSYAGCGCVDAIKNFLRQRCIQFLPAAVMTHVTHRPR